jgi:hypothetical protein
MSRRPRTRGGSSDWPPATLEATDSRHGISWFMDGGKRAATATFPAVATTWQAQSRNAE